MKRLFTLAAALCVCMGAHAATTEIQLHQVTVEGKGAAIGTIKIDETPYGLQFTPRLRGLPPGIHGFHVHAKGSCEPGVSEGKIVAAGAAGGHLDPANTRKHAGPYRNGHLGDLPALYVNAEGESTYPVLAPRLKNISEIKGKALMVHVGGDNHEDKPLPLGGGGGRFACGVI